MGFFSKITKPFKKAANKVIKPFQKLSDKLIPNELRPLLPYASMFLPMSGIMGGLGGPMGFAKMYGANMLTQAMGDPEADFEDLNQISGILSGLQGGLSGKNTASNLRDSATFGSGAEQGPLTASQAQTLADRSLLTKASDLGKNISAVGSDYLKGNMDTLRDIGAGRMPLNLETAKAGLKAIGPEFAKATGDVAVNYARPMMREFEKADAAEREEYETNMDDRNREQADMTMLFMRQAGHDEQTIEDTLALDGLESYYSAPTESAAQGGIIGLKGGGIPDDEFMELVSKLREDGFSQEEAIEEAIRQLSENKANGGIIGLKEGGMLNFGGREMDLRTGGFVPIGKKERADDVPARLSKNEFVMTADAVRAAGGGSVNKGAQRMYDVMNKLEARA